MINWKVRIKNKQFWVSIIPALAILVQAVAAVFGYTLNLCNTNGALAYLPALGDLERGGYEVQPDVDTVAPEASDVLIEASVKNL